MSKLSQTELAKRGGLTAGDRKETPGVVRTSSVAKQEIKRALKRASAEDLQSALMKKASGREKGLRTSVSELERGKVEKEKEAATKQEHAQVSDFIEWIKLHEDDLSDMEGARTVRRHMEQALDLMEHVSKSMKFRLFKMFEDEFYKRFGEEVSGLMGSERSMTRGKIAQAAMAPAPETEVDPAMSM